MNQKTKQRGLGIVSILSVTFIALKLLGTIPWSWIWVLSPIWISIAIAFLLLSGIFIAGRIKKGRW